MHPPFAFFCFVICLHTSLGFTAKESSDMEFQRTPDEIAAAYPKNLTYSIYPLDVFVGDFAVYYRVIFSRFLRHYRLFPIDIVLGNSL